MKTLLIVTLILSSTFAFSETREEHQRKELEIKLKRSQKIEENNYFESLVAGNVALISYAADYDLNKKIKRKQLQKKPTIKIPFLKLKKGAITTAGLMAAFAASYYLGEGLISTNEVYKLKRELKEIENTERNTRKKVAETSSKKLTRSVSATQMN